MERKKIKHLKSLKKIIDEFITNNPEMGDLSIDKLILRSKSNIALEAKSYKICVDDEGNEYAYYGSGPCPGA